MINTAPELNENTFLIYAIKHYDSTQCTGMKEFLDDLNTFKYIKRLLKRYRLGKELKERLILNHIILLYNLFGAEATTHMLFYKIESEYWPILKTFLLYLNYIDMDTKLFDGTDGVIIPVNLEVAAKLRKI